MKPCLRVALTLLGVFSAGIARAQPEPKPAPPAQSPRTPAGDAAERAEELRELEMPEADFAELLATVPDGRLPPETKRDAALFAMLAESKFLFYGLSGLSMPEHIRKLDRLLSRVLRRLEASGEPARPHVERGERLVAALRIIHCLAWLEPGSGLERVLGVKPVVTKREGGGGEEERALDVSAVTACFGELLMDYLTNLGLPLDQKLRIADRSAPIYTAPLAKLVPYPGKPENAALASVRDRLTREYAIEYEGDYLFEPKDTPPGIRVFVHYQKPEIGPAEEIPASAEEKALGIDWKGKATVRPASARLYDARRPAGQRWEPLGKTEGFTFHLSHERGIYYVDAIEKLGKYEPYGPTTIRAKAIEALGDR